MNNWIFNGDYGLAPLNVPMLLLGLLLSFVCGQMTAWVYMITHGGLSYSKSFVNALVIMPLLVCLVMQVLSNNLVTAFGLMAVFAIVRFRNILRDTLDTTFVLTVIVVGMACGTQKYSTALVGTVLVLLVFLYLWYTGFGARHRYDLILNLHWDKPVSEMPVLAAVLDRHSIKTECASQRSNEDQAGADLSYRLLLRDTSRVQELLSELKALTGVSRVSSLKAEDESEL
ncbi:MAG: DUF4956 domain-containing protein [Verrucomicrobia bacterium]|nr:DUF4956 domain-containing protein [Verrucomicrobiota bacterium]